jgi:hypothetical protein
MKCALVLASHNAATAIEARTNALFLLQPHRQRQAVQKQRVNKTSGNINVTKNIIFTQLLE